MASEKINALVEEYKKLTVLELSELVKALEEEFGVSAAAMAASNAGPAAPVVEETTQFDVVHAGFDSATHRPGPGRGQGHRRRRSQDPEGGRLQGRGRRAEEEDRGGRRQGRAEVISNPAAFAFHGRHRFGVWTETYYAPVSAAHRGIFTACSVSGQREGA